MAETVGKLNLKLAVDGSEFGPGLQRESQNLERFGEKTATTAEKIKAGFAGVGRAGQDVFRGFASGGPTGAIDALGGAVGGLGEKVAALAGPIGITVAAFTAGFLAINKLAEDTTKRLNDINRLSRLIGENGQSTQTLLNVFDTAGIDDAQGTLLRFFDKLGELRQSLSEGNGGGQTGDVLRRIGLDPNAIANASPTQAFEQIIIALHNVNNAYDRATASQAIFSRQFRDMAPIIDRGAAAFAGAQNRTQLAGASNATLAAAEEARRIERQLAESGLTSGTDAIGRMWDSFASRWQLGYQRFRRDLYQALGAEIRPPVQAQNQIAETFQFNAAAAAAERTRMANQEATKLLDTWNRSLETAGMTTRQIELQKIEQSGASNTLIEQLRLRNRELELLEERNRREQQLRAIIQGNQGALSTFLDRLVALRAAFNLPDRDRTTVLAASFRDLERSLGLGSQQSLALDGVGANTVEGARIIADRQARDRNGADNIQTRVLEVLLLSRELQQAQLRESQAIARALENIPQLLIAPLNRGR